jgi:hypothetical protein
MRAALSSNRRKRTTLIKSIQALRGIALRVAGYQFRTISTSGQCSSGMPVSQRPDRGRRESAASAAALISRTSGLVPATLAVIPSRLGGVTVSAYNSPVDGTSFFTEPRAESMILDFVGLVVLHGPTRPTVAAACVC